MIVPYDLMVKIINESASCRQYLEQTYPDRWKWYQRFSQQSSPACPFARAALKEIYLGEYKAKGQDFVTQLRLECWGAAKT
jgi:hypothetical protein